MDNTVKTILIVFFVIIVLYLMSALSGILIPLVLAILFALLFQPLTMKLSKSKIPNWFILPIIIIITLGILFGILNIIISTISQIAEQQQFLIQRLEIRANDLLLWINSTFGFHFTTGNLFEEINGKFDSDWMQSAAGGIASSVGSFTGSFLMFSLYYVVLLAGMSNFHNYVEYIAAEKKEVFFEYAENLQNSIIKYIITKFFISLTTGIIIFIICTVFGIKFAMFWGFFTFTLNFIPSIGSIISTIPPVLMAVVQYDTFQTPLIMLIILIVIQFSIGNLIEPKIMGDRLKLNTITVIFGLVFWGYIWGIPGMVLSVPLMVFVKLLFENIPSLSIVARIMSTPEKKIK
ncbi:AI-2E family transporter [Bacteroidetes/Chlorobi group bacterium ChocPot_Mid]|jgi:predicted PurR-regulated permease PerM|nr:MAG: AI-2E family transporter [Bacteroidetes/Chlorobi group bacterium ChocPot_Mid]